MIYQAREDSLLLAEEVKKYAKNKRVLDIGSGSGILAETALNAGAKRSDKERYYNLIRSFKTFIRTDISWTNRENKNY